MKRLVIGVLAHVDAGKTTLCEGLLYTAGQLRRLGRVDHGDTCLDHEALERRRGITIFSKQAPLRLPEAELTLLDTPGHVDFSAEMERTLQVLDYAILVISGTDGVQAHTATLWRLLRRYRIPAFVFVTKMDLPGADQSQLLQQLRQKLDPGCVDMTAPGWQEELALCDEGVLESYLRVGTLSDETAAGLIAARRAYPCYFGAGLRLEGLEPLLSGLQRFTLQRTPLPAFGASVFKISRDSQGNRLTFLKVTGGTLQVRDAVGPEKVSQLRVYTGAKFAPVSQVGPGGVCAALGLQETRSGQGLGLQPDAPAPQLRPVLRYRLRLPPDCDTQTALRRLAELEEEDPQLHIGYDPALREIYLQLMGEVQIEVLQQLIQARFDLPVQLDEGRILYQETIAAPAEGVGHYEPLRHYAEVHLLLEPLEPGSGVVLDADCSEDVLARSWQRLILAELAAKQHRGVLTGAPVTDLKITLKAGRAHLKHTEGGDFREAAWRAVRQGLMQAKSVLLAPVYAFRLELPLPQLGRAMQDIKRMAGRFDPPETGQETVTLTGTAPVSTMRGYAREVAAYTQGRGQLQCRVDGYAPCHNAEAVCAAIGYDPAADLENPPGSIFCAHGAGFYVPWDKVPDYMHLGSILEQRQPDTPPPVRTRNLRLDDRELEAIMEREFGPVRRRQYTAPARSDRAATAQPPPTPHKTLIVVDGYNLIFCWSELAALAASDLAAAREKLLERLANYRAFTGRETLVVFDAYRVRGGRGSRSDHHGVHVVYTAENETGDLYIERLAHEIGKNYAVCVVTSDALVQLSALRSGVLRVSAREFLEEVAAAEAGITQTIAPRPSKTTIGQQLGWNGKENP